MINGVCGIRSTGRICTDIAQMLERQGHTVKIAYGREEVPTAYQKYAVRIGSDTDVKIAGAEARLFDNAGFSNKKATERFIRWVQKYNPDIIHLHNIHGYYLNIEMLFDYLKTCGKKVIWTLHDCWAFTGHCTYFDYVGCDKWKNGCGDCPQKTSYPASYVLDRSKQNYKKKERIFNGVDNMTLVTPSAWLARLVKESFMAKYDVGVIHNGIDTEIFHPTKSVIRKRYHFGDKKVILGVSSGWLPSKHLDYMIQMAKDLGKDYQVVLIGLSKNQKESLPNNVLGFTKTNNVNELVEWYSTADVFVNPTMQDNYPTVNLEAQACGTPVVTFNSGGSGECIKEGYGIVVDRGNYTELLNSTKRAILIKKSTPRIRGQKEFTEDYLKLYIR